MIPAERAPAPDRPDFPEAVRAAPTIAALDAHLIECRACPRLVEWREHVAEVKRAAFRDEDYWGRPVPSFGDEAARILIVGLAPAAHGANRTGRMFTGDRSGEFLFASMFRTGLANRPVSAGPGDGLRLIGARVTSPVRCAPPANKPTPDERRRCGPYLARELELLGEVRVAIALGGFGWDALLRTLGEQGWAVPRPRPKFAHGAEVTISHPDRTGGAASLRLLGCFHVSQQNTFTGRLTPEMLDAVFERAKELAGLAQS